MFTASSRAGSGRVQFLVVIPSNAVPSATSRSADASTSAASGSCGGRSTSSTCAGGSRPRPAYVVSTGAPSRHASSVTASAAPDCTAPPPTHSTGRSAAASSRSAASTSAADGGAARPAAPRAAAAPRRAGRRPGRRRGSPRTPVRAAGHRERRGPGHRLDGGQRRGRTVDGLRERLEQRTLVGHLVQDPPRRAGPAQRRGDLRGHQDDR